MVPRPGDKDWYRAAVLQELPNNEFDVQYIDYGNGEKVPLSLMRPFSDNMAAVPVLGIKCCIAGKRLINRYIIIIIMIKLHFVL